jgi:hypothetical protein
MRSNSLQKKVFRGMGKKHFNTEQDAIATPVFQTFLCSGFD